MNCHEIQNELLLTVGENQLSDEIKKHLNECSDCKNFWESIDSVTEMMGDDSNFYLSDIETEQIINKVNFRTETPKKNVISIYKILTAAAAVILVLGVTYIAQKAGEFDRFGNIDTTVIHDSSVSQGAKASQIVLEDLFNEGDFDLVNSENIIVGEDMWDYLSDEDLKYLEDNFDIEDLL